MSEADNNGTSLALPGEEQCYKWIQLTAKPMVEARINLHSIFRVFV